MTDIEREIFRLASLGASPAEIEKTLNLPPNRIHEKYHSVLMEGYQQREKSVGKTSDTASKKEKQAERARQYYQANKEKIAEQHRRYYRENKEKLAEQHRRYYQANKEKHARWMRLYYGENKEKICARRRQNYQANKLLKGDENEN